MDLGVGGGVQMMDPLYKWPVVEHDRVVRMIGAAGPEEPWPMPPQEVSIEERLIGLDTRVRQIIAIAGPAVETGLHIRAEKQSTTARTSLVGQKQNPKAES
jgi:hypothetical protein